MLTVFERIGDIFISWTRSEVSQNHQNPGVGRPPPPSPPPPPPSPSVAPPSVPRPDTAEDMLNRLIWSVESVELRTSLKTEPDMTMFLLVGEPD
uniref:Uncharacterized protein n=1 Tax=Tanacetum cinerariifolium TaxID=118510 RepID=A0A699ICB5_TANCI|nr:hypothetical protein [Tanacetum cinerariifolium]